MFRLRPFGERDREQDFQLLHTLSNYQVPQDPVGNREWQQRRREYDETRGVRRHYIAELAETGEPVAYAAIEQQGADPTDFRLYTVFDPGRFSYPELGEFLYQRLLQDARELQAGRLVFVEYASDARFLEFIESRGFVRVGTATFNGFEIVRLEKRL